MAADSRNWAGELFKAFTEDNQAKITELSKFASPKTKCSLKLYKDVFEKRKSQGITPFITAILHGDILLCEQLIEEGIDMGQNRKVHYQITFEGEEYSKFNKEAYFQIVHGPSTNVFKDFQLTTPMFWAIKFNNIPLIDKLITKGHNKNSFVEKLAGLPALALVILEKNMPLVQYFLQKQSCDIHAPSFCQLRSFEFALINKDRVMILFLLNQGETLDCDKHTLSPLLQAVSFNYFDMAQFLISLGGNVSFGLELGKTLPPLNLAIDRNQFDMATFLIKQGADVKAKDLNGNTALHLLAYHSDDVQSQLVIAQLLLEKKAKVDVTNNNVDTPLGEAVYMNCLELVDILLTTTVDLNTFNKGGFTLLQAAVSGLKSRPAFVKQHPEIANNKNQIEKQHKIVQLLLEKGADINKKSRDGRAALHFAIVQGDRKIVKLLLQNKADVNSKTSDGKVALHYAVLNNRFKLVKLLLESNAEVNVKDGNGCSPFGFGAMATELNIDIANLLVDYGADVLNPVLFVRVDIYDITVLCLNANLIKLLWRKGYILNDVEFKSYDNLVESLKSTLCDLNVREKLSIDVKRRLSFAHLNTVLKLIAIQNEFMTGIKENNVELVSSALQKGAEVRGCSKTIPFPLHFLAEQGFTDVAQIILSKGVLANNLDGSGRSPLECSIMYGNFQIYITLLQYGACYNKASLGRSDFQSQAHQHYKLHKVIKQAFRSVKQGDHHVLKKLEQCVRLKKWCVYRALANCVDRKGQTLMSLAVKKGHSVIVRELMKYRLQAPELD